MTEGKKLDAFVHSVLSEPMLNIGRKIHSGLSTCKTSHQKAVKVCSILNSHLSDLEDKDPLRICCMCGEEESPSVTLKHLQIPGDRDLYCGEACALDGWALKQHRFMPVEKGYQPFFPVTNNVQYALYPDGTIVRVEGLMDRLKRLIDKGRRKVARFKGPFEKNQRYKLSVEFLNAKTKDVIATQTKSKAAGPHNKNSLGAEFDDYEVPKSPNGIGDDDYSGTYYIRVGISRGVKKDFVEGCLNFDVAANAFEATGEDGKYLAPNGRVAPAIRNTTASFHVKNKKGDIHFVLEIENVRGVYYVKSLTVNVKPSGALTDSDDLKNFIMEGGDMDSARRRISALEREDDKPCEYVFSQRSSFGPSKVRTPITADLLALLREEMLKNHYQDEIHSNQAFVGKEFHVARDEHLHKERQFSVDAHEKLLEKIACGLCGGYDDEDDEEDDSKEKVKALIRNDIEQFIGLIVQPKPRINPRTGQRTRIPFTQRILLSTLRSRARRAERRLAAKPTNLRRQRKFNELLGRIRGIELQNYGKQLTFPGQSQRRSFFSRPFGRSTTQSVPPPTQPGVVYRQPVPTQPYYAPQTGFAGGMTTPSLAPPPVSYGTTPNFAATAPMMTPGFGRPSNFYVPGTLLRLPTGQTAVVQSKLK